MVCKFSGGICQTIRIKQESLLMNSFSCQYLEVPFPQAPQHRTWIWRMDVLTLVCSTILSHVPERRTNFLVGDGGLKSKCFQMVSFPSGVFQTPSSRTGSVRILALGAIWQWNFRSAVTHVMGIPWYTGIPLTVCNHHIYILYNYVDMGPLQLRLCWCYMYILAMAKDATSWTQCWVVDSSPMTSSVSWYCCKLGRWLTCSKNV